MNIIQILKLFYISIENQLKSFVKLKKMFVVFVHRKLLSSSNVALYCQKNNLFLDSIYLNYCHANNNIIWYTNGKGKWSLKSNK